MFEDLEPPFEIIYQFLDGYIDRFFKLYNGYKGLQDYLSHSRSIFNIFDTKIKNLLLEYCRYEDISVELPHYSEVDPDGEALEKMKHRYLFLFQDYLYKRIKQHIVENRLYQAFEEFESKQESELDYQSIMHIFNKIAT